MDLYLVCSNYTPGAKNGPATRGHMFNIGLNRENMKTSCLKPQGLKPWYLVCSITSWTYATFVQIMPLGPKMARPHGSHGLHRLNRKTWKNLIVWNHKAFDMWHHLVGPLPSLFKLCPCSQKKPPTPNIKLTFSEYGHVAYQIKGNAAYNTILANILLLHLPFTPWVGSEG